MSTVIASNLQASGATGTAALLASINGGPISGARNRIINGDMRIDQRNAGASVTLPAATGTYVLDRWTGYEDTDGTATVQRSTAAPAGFTNSLLVTTTTADASLSATQRFTIAHLIEGFNAADLGWGAAGALSVTLSFWVRSSLTGTFGAVISNGAYNRSYPFTYSISSANTWEYKTVTIAGDTTGTWATDNTAGIVVKFGLGVGTTFSGTAGSWQAADFNSATGAVSVIGTLNATWQITGVQLEAGSVATPFERRSYGQELALCQRYFQLIDYQTSNGGIAANWYTFNIPFLMQMRAGPTMVASAYNSNTGNANTTQDSGTVNGWTLDGATLNQAVVRGANTSLNRSISGRGQFSAEL
jgi:hypothetical protein